MMIEPEALRPSDFGPVVALLQENGLNAADLDREAMVEFVGIRERGVLAAIGALQAFGSDGLLRSVATDRSFRKRGYAALIVARLEAEGRRRGVSRIYLLTDTATAYFEQLGYRHEPRSTAPDAISGTDQFSLLCPDSASLMVKRSIIEP